MKFARWHHALPWVFCLFMLSAGIGHGAGEEEDDPTGTFDAVFAAAPGLTQRVSETTKMTFPMFMISVTTKNHSEYTETTLSIDWEKSEYAVERRYDMAEAGGSWAAMNESLAQDVGEAPLRIDSRNGIRFVDAGKHDKKQRKFVDTLKPLDFDWLLLRALLPHGRRGQRDTWELPETTAARLIATLLQESKGDARMPWVENPDARMPETSTGPEAAGTASGRFKKLTDDAAILVIDCSGGGKLDKATRARDLRGTVTLYIDLNENRFTRLDAHATCEYDEDSGETFHFKLSAEKTWKNVKQE